MFHDQLDPDVIEAVRERVEANPNVMTQELARELGLSEGAVISALPVEMRAFAPADAFIRIWKAMAEWERATFIVVTPGVIVEVKGKLPKGSFGRGFFNLMDCDNPLGGHLRVDMIHSICFLSKPVFNLESHSVQFLDKHGAVIFSVYVGRENKRLIESARASFFALRDVECTEAAEI